jgi:hypothetical protein
MKFTECMIAWTPQSYADWKPDLAGTVEVGPWPDETGWSDKHARTCGACFTEVHKQEQWQRNWRLFVDFHTLTVRDGIAPQKAHEAFLAIDEYRQLISPDIAGAEH